MQDTRTLVAVYWI